MILVARLASFFLLASLTLSDPPRGWNVLADPDEGYSFNYPQEFRLKRTSDMSRRELVDPKTEAALELVVMELGKAPSFDSFASPGNDRSKTEVIEKTPASIITAAPSDKRTVFRKLLLGKAKAFLLTATYPTVADPALNTKARNTAIRVLKSLRAIG
jgi:hypothetical protein